MPVAIYHPTKYMIHANRLTRELEVLPLLPDGHGGGSAGILRAEGEVWIASSGIGKETVHATQDEAARSLIAHTVMRIGTDDDRSDD